MSNSSCNSSLIIFYLLFHSIDCYFSAKINEPNIFKNNNDLLLQQFGRRNRIILQSSSSSSSALKNNINKEDNDEDLQRNTKYINSLLNNLSVILDKFFMGRLPSDTTKVQVSNILQLIKRKSMKKELVDDAIRMIERVGIEVNDKEEEKEKDNTSSMGRNAISYEREDNTIINARKEWEEEQKFSKPNDINNFINDKESFQDEVLQNNNNNNNNNNADYVTNTNSNNNAEEDITEAEKLASELIAKAGAKPNTFSGTNLGIGGLDDILQQIKRRVWVPLSVPPIILKQLGIQPVRGLLLYGAPGCGKTLIGRTIGKILSPTRPITVISGPEIMEKYIGSSEANIRNIFDLPPDLYPNIQNKFSNNPMVLSSLSKNTLHVIIMDEIDAIARSRGNDNQGDAGIARDSVVNQLLAKMDGVQELPVPTLVIGLTNRRSLMDDALLRAGRFEVQIEVPPPRTTEQRISILNVHMKHMYQSGRVLVSDAPIGTVAHQKLKEFENTKETILTYDELVCNLAKKCTNKMSGASIASICRAAASHALERAVYDFETYEEEDHEEQDEDYYYHQSIMNCLVTKDDFEYGLNDILDNMKNNDDETTSHYDDKGKEEEIENEEVNEMDKDDRGGKN